MGDSRRFWSFAELIVRHFPNPVPTVDVAGGKGHLQAALRRHGHSDVVSWDRRQKYANPERANRYRYGLFDAATAPPDYGLAVGMHPDGGTDHIIQYAARHQIPFVVCPCCAIPSAVPYRGSSDYDAWMRHLVRLAEASFPHVEIYTLPIHGRATVIVGRPPKVRK